MASHAEHDDKKETAIAIAEPMTRQDSINEQWQMCCSGSSSHFIKYLSQLLVYLTILVFALVNISLGKNDPIYWSLLTLIVGAMAPAPSLKKGGK